MVDVVGDVDVYGYEIKCRVFKPKFKGFAENITIFFMKENILREPILVEENIIKRTSRYFKRYNRPILTAVI